MVREQVMLALYQQLLGAAAWKTSGRRLQHWQKVSAQPALFLVEGDEEYPTAASHDARLIIIDAEVWLYSQFGSNPKIGVDGDVNSPASELNALIDAVEQAVKSPVPFRQPNNLGLQGIVHCRIEGKVLKDPGHLGGQAIAIVPIRIMAGELQ